MRTIFRFSLVSALVLCAATAMAIPFDNSAGGPVTATIASPSGGDYTSLGAAAAAFSAVSGSINRPWTLSVGDGHYNETVNVCFGNTFGAGGSLTIKPAAGATPVFDFTSTATASGWFGHFIIGCSLDGHTNAPSVTNTFSSNGNYIIDGSNTVAGTTRDMTFQVGVPTPLASPMSRLIRIVANNDGVIIRNLNVTMQDSNGTTISCIGLAGGQLPSGGATVIPDNALIENCHLSNTGTTAGNPQTIETTLAGNGTVPSGTAAIQGLTVRDCLIEARQRGVFMNGVGSNTISGNRIILTGHPTSGFANTGIFHFTSNNVPNWTAQWYDNDLSIASNLTTITAGQGNYGMYINFDAAPNTPASGEYVIHDNVIRDVSFPALAAPTDLFQVGMWLGSVNSSYEVQHNSINLSGDTEISGVTEGRVAAIRIPGALTTGSIRLRNNIVRMGAEVAANTAAIMSWAAATNITSLGNDLYPTGAVPPAFGRIGAAPTTPTTTFAAWQLLGYDTVVSGGQSVDPTTTNPGKWLTDLRFSYEPSNLGTVAASTFLTDIDGDARPATGAFPGADQNNDLPTAAENWTSYR